MIGVHDDLTPIKKTMDEFKPTITFNLMEAFDDIIVFDQNVVSYLELLKVPYTGCNPRGLTLSRDKALAKKLMAYHRIPVPDFLVVPLGGKVKLPKRLQFPLIVKSLTYESSTGISQASVVDNDEQLAKRVQFIHDTIMTPAIVEEFIDGRELYVRRDGQRSAADVPGVGDVVLRRCPRTTGRSPPSASSGASSTRRSTASTRRWRGCPRSKRPRCSTWPSASIARSICRATRVSICA